MIVEKYVFVVQNIPSVAFSTDKRCEKWVGRNVLYYSHLQDPRMTPLLR